MCEICLCVCVSECVCACLMCAFVSVCMSVSGAEAFCFPCGSQPGRFPRARAPPASHLSSQAD